MTFKTLFAASVITFLSGSASAHDRWLLPSHSNVSSDDGEWIMVDVSASNQAFNADKPLGAENLRVITPAKKSTRPSSSYRGHRKSVVDVELKDSGTYRLEIRNDARYWTRFTVDGKKDWLRGSKLDVQNKLPKGATNVASTLSYSVVQTYVTLNNPTDNFGLTNNGLELLPVTHPSDIAQGETATFKMVFNGKPQANVKVDIVREGARYRNNPEVLERVSDKQGLIRFTPVDAGRYLLMANYSETVKNNPLADEIGGQLFLTFEVILD